MYRKHRYESVAWSFQEKVAAFRPLLVPVSFIHKLAEDFVR